MRTMVMLVVLLTAGMAQQGTAGPQFAVVSIRPQSPSFQFRGKPPGLVYPGGKYINRQAILWTLIAFAYPECVFPDKTLVGLPSWAYDGTRVFDVEAEPKPGRVPSLEEMRGMMAAALAGRFRLKAHFVERKMPVELLEPAGSGLRHVTASAPGQQSLQLQIGPSGIYGRGATMGELARKLTAFLYSEGRPAVDRTGLTGYYDIDGPPAPGDAHGGAMLRVLLGRIGLKLVQGEAAVKVMVVDQVNLPTPN